MVERCAICGVLLRSSSRPRKATCERGACAHEYRRRIWAEPGARACLVCGRRIVAGIAGDTCGEVYCREELDSRLYRVRRELERREAKEAAARRVEAQLQQSCEAPSDAVTAVLPAHDRSLGPQDPARRTLFAERLAGVMDDATADPEGPTGDPPHPEDPVTPADILARSACASCRGLCCKHGEQHAFLRPATLRRTLKLHPEQTPAQALDMYLSYIPAESTAGSCIYHGCRGCTLPRALRSDVCNRFICDDLDRLQKVVVAGERVPPIVAVGFDEDRLVRVSLIQGDRVQTVIEAPPAP
jgi:hypothetical protein